jgi:Na+-transporting methylmalonyl-CoA/oxaloacetate decarboxylase gamma subunit
MEIDWGQALEYGGVGFVLVFIVLAILAVATWLVNLISHKTTNGGNGDKAPPPATNGAPNGGTNPK